jgi:signal transduction histidine kinase
VSPLLALYGRLRRHPLAADAALAALVLVASAAALGSRGSAAAWGFTVALPAPLVWRRRAPWAMFLLTAAIAFAQWVARVETVADLALVVALYTVAVHEPRRRILAAAGVVEVGVVLATVRWASEAPHYPFLFLTAMAIAATALGLNVRTRRRYLASLEERAAQLERERDQQGRLAAAAERSRIAREMHDIVAHNLSVMVALADGAGFVARSDPERSAGAMEEVSRTGRHALGEMRRLLGVLRDGDGADRAPQPGLGELDALLERVRAAGLPVVLETSGSPDGLGPGAGLTVYRVVQEALTNTLKHAGEDARATVRLRFDAGGVEVEVADDGRGAAPAAGAGQGLAGMRQRAAVHGGAVEAGPGRGGGWRVHARLRDAT